MFKKLLKQSTGEIHDDYEIFIGDILHHPRYGMMQVMDTVENKTCLLLARVPLDKRDRQFVEEIKVLSWSPKIPGISL